MTQLLLADYVGEIGKNCLRIFRGGKMRKRLLSQILTDFISSMRGRTPRFFKCNFFLKFTQSDHASMESLAIKYSIVLIGILLTQSMSFGSSRFSGVIEKTTGGVFLRSVDEATSQTYIAKYQQGDLRETFNKLSTGDFVIGSGNLNSDKRVLYVDSIESVGLQKILGRWKNKENILEFKSFSELQVYSFSAIGSSGNGNLPNELRYSIAPGKVDDWTIFMSNQDATVLGSLSLNSDVAVLKIYNPDNGEPMKVLRLNRTP